MAPWQTLLGFVARASRRKSGEEPGGQRRTDADTFRDPEGMYYLARQLSYLGQESSALLMLGDPSTMAFSAFRHGTRSLV